MSAPLRRSTSAQNDSSNINTRVYIPRDWRDHLARAINDRDLTRIEHLIHDGAQHGRTRFNDPLIADASFLLEMAAKQSYSHQQHHRHQQHTSPKRVAAEGTRATRAKLADEKRGGSMSWVAPPVSSLVSGNPHRRDNNNNPLGNTISLRERVSQLREMALFPDSTAQGMNSSMTGDLSGVSFQGSVNNRNSSSSVNMSTINQHQQLFRKFQQQQQSPDRSHRSAAKLISTGRGLGTLTPTEIDDAAAAMGVPSLWIERPVGVNWDITKPSHRDSEDHHHNQQQNPHSSRRRRQFYPERGSPSSAEASASPVRSVFEDVSVTGAALRLHSFVHSDEQPDVKASRLYQAYVSMDRMIPRDDKNSNNAPKPSTATTSAGKQQQSSQQVSSDTPAKSINNATFPSADFFSPGTVSDSTGFGSPLTTASRDEHDRLVRKLSHEAQAPAGVEVTRMLRFLAASEAMNRGALEQESAGVIHNNLANYRYGLLHSKGISTDRGSNQSKVFLDNNGVSAAFLTSF